MLLSRTPVLVTALVAERSRSWVIDYLAVITATARGSGGRGAPEQPDRERTPRTRTLRVPAFNIVIRPWNGPPPTPSSIIRAELQKDPELHRLREPEPEPEPGLRLDYFWAKWQTIRSWVELYDSSPALARQVLADYEDTFELDPSAPSS